MVLVGVVAVAVWEVEPAIHVLAGTVKYMYIGYVFVSAVCVFSCINVQCCVCSC